MEYLHMFGAIDQPDICTDQPMGHAIVMFVFTQLHMVVFLDLALCMVPEFITASRKGKKQWLFLFFKHLLSAVCLFLKVFFVVLGQFYLDGCIELPEACENLVSQCYIDAHVKIWTWFSTEGLSLGFLGLAARRAVP